MQRTLKLYRLPETTKTPGFREMKPKDVPKAHKLLMDVSIERKAVEKLGNCNHDIDAILRRLPQLLAYGGMERVRKKLGIFPVGGIFICWGNDVFFLFCFFWGLGGGT